MRFSDAYLLDLPGCLWSVSQCLTPRVCGPWYGSLSVAEEQLLPPDGQCSGQRYWRGCNLYFTWTWNFLFLQLNPWSSLERLLLTSVICDLIKQMYMHILKPNQTICNDSRFIYLPMNCIYVYFCAIYFVPMKYGIYICNLHLWVKCKKKMNPMDNWGDQWPMKSDSTWYYMICTIYVRLLYPCRLLSL